MSAKLLLFPDFNGDDGSSDRVVSLLFTGVLALLLELNFKFSINNKSRNLYQIAG